MFQDSKESWYRQLSYPTTEFRWAGKKGPGLPHVLIVRSTLDNNMKAEFEIMDVATAPIGAYMRLADVKFIEIIEQRNKDERAKREAAFDKSERAREALEASHVQKEQLPQGSIGEPERKAEGSVTKEDYPRRDDEVQHGSQSEPPKKKRGRPRKDSSESRDGGHGIGKNGSPVRSESIP